MGGLKIALMGFRRKAQPRMQWQSSRALAEANRSRVATKQQMNSLDSAAQRQKVATNYQIQRQNVMAEWMIAHIQRSQATALAMKQQSTTLTLMAQQYAKSPVRRIAN